MTDKIIEQLEEYFKNSKQEVSFGIQNFQGVREYTKIPLAPLTLVYGQNSAGKSTIHDAQQFIHGYFSGQWDSATTKEYLNRWANHNRVSEPLAKGYLGNPDDVVISVFSVTGWDDYSEYQEQTYYQNKFSNKYSVTGLTEVFFNRNQDTSIPFRIDIHFSDSLDDWIVRQISLYLGDDIFAEFIFDDSAKYDVQDGYALLRINKKHLVYSLLNGYFEGGITLLSKYNFHQNDAGDDWFLFFDMDVTGSLELKNLIGWYDVDECFWDSNPSPEIIELRTFILSLLQIPAIGIVKNFNFASVPPLRPIPGSFLADPVFEATFGWQQADMGLNALKGKLLHADLIAALNKPQKKGLVEDYTFSATQRPYRHQLEAWRALIEAEPQRSVLVSSGTGSGKTECFLIPILHDLVAELEQHQGTPLTGVRALFLYPLNALIKSQKDRLVAWSEPFKGKLRFCLYNGDTPDQGKSDWQSEVADRRTLRSNPPPILVTNATMLEYMLVRNEDRTILDQSQGQLRWIVIDEAHSYQGSQAAELTLLLRRVLHAFGSQAGEVHFVATSATLGDSSDESRQRLAEFLADIAGVSVDRVTVIEGKRETAELLDSLRLPDVCFP